MRRASWPAAALLLTAVDATAQPTPSPPGPAPVAPPAPAVPAPRPNNGAAATPAPGDAPPGYYVEPPSPPNAVQNQEPPPERGVTVYEPPPPGFYPPGAMVYEPPPPPEPHHIAPRTSLWLGLRAGWFIPFGNVWAHDSGPDQYGDAILQGVPWSRYASSGPMFELDVGMRVARSYNVFALWERASLGAGSSKTEPDGSVSNPSGGDSDFFGLGVRANTDPDRVGFVTELAIGYRRARSKWDDGAQLQLTDAPFEARIGLGAEIRLNKLFALSPMLTVGVGSFETLRFVKNNTTSGVLGVNDTSDGHAWATLTLGGHFDLVGTN